MSSLSVVIPALNEEASIGRTIERCLAIRNQLLEEVGLEFFEIIVISDGSTDRTAEIAGSYEDVKLIAYEKNRGYGAAIKLGFATGKGDIVGFLDADGTCDPNNFIPMCLLMAKEKADIVLGSRLHKLSKMPKVRRLGNRIYALIISIISNTRITDSASGMRIIKRSALNRLYPLPNGLHFTPAMSCKAVLDPELKILEIPMSYEERAGQSKLKVIKDGFSFLNVILDISMSYRPRKLIGSAGLFLLAIALAYSFYPIEFYLQNRRLEEWMIYRLITIMIVSACGLNIISIGEIAEHMLELAGYGSTKSYTAYLLKRFFNQQSLLVIGVISALIGILSNVKTVYQYITTQHIYLHWSYIVFGGTFLLAGTQLIGLALLLRFTSFLLVRLLPENNDKVIAISSQEKPNLDRLKINL